MLHLTQDFNNLFTLDAFLSVLTLTVLEIVLGIDNIIFISIVAGKLTLRKEQRKARAWGLILALIMRIILLFSITWIIGLKEPLLNLGAYHASGRDLILLAGGLFLLYKTTLEIHTKIEGKEEAEVNVRKVTLNAIIAQIVFIDIIFSFDSILTAVGIANNLLVMILAVICSMIIMLIFSEKISDFINNHPTIKILALAFLLMIGFLLVLESFHVEVPKPYVYCAMAFSFLVELLNMRMHKNNKRKRKG